MDVQANLVHIQNDIEDICKQVGRDSSEITIIAVTKYVTIERTEEAIRAGITHIGENRAEQFIEKKQNIHEEATWHFIGTLQSRKVKDIVHEVDMIHSLDRISVANQIERRATEAVDCFIQVNVSGEESKHGLQPNEVEDFIDELSSYEKVRIVGLMTMAPHVEDEAVIRQTFQQLAQLRDTIQAKQEPHAPCNYLSMGMSNDYKIAIEEGATHIRIGSKLVGS
ncbi:MAG TPA: YggS family pyridoxal phosphate-dependent enzyme [Bacillota bacterium]|nr:YggS family pyridoxal phosphate-dependent enzyme [Bacillota bacterium]